MRWFIAGLLLVHGVIHVLGFLKWWRLAEVPQLTGRTLWPLSDGALRGVGLLWLLATVLFVIAAGMRALNQEAWWMLGAPTLVLSQLLIVLQWHDAKAGTLANVVILVAVVIAGALAVFRQQSAQRVQTLLAGASTQNNTVVTAQEIAHLPPPVQRWLRASGAVGHPRASTARLRQRGGMRTAADKPWMHAEATQYFTIGEPAFIWCVDVTMFGMPVIGRDSYVDGHGRMLIKLLGLITVADGTGPGFDQGTALRFLGEIIWFPSAALADYIRWDAIDDDHARATLDVRGTRVSADFGFDARGRLTSLEAMRSYNGGTLERWSIPITEWRVIRGIEMPTQGGALWKLKSGDFDYYRWEIVDVEPNVPALY